jgi:hypothetical protein
MHFVLDHGAQPFPDGDRRPTGRDALLIEIRFRQAAQDVHRLAVHLIEERKDLGRAVGQLPPVARITAGLALSVLGIHVALDCAQVADDIGETEFSFAAGPIKSLGRNAGNNLVRALPHLLVVIKELLWVAELHRAPRPLDSPEVPEALEFSAASLDFRDAALAWVFLELKRIVARDDAVRRAGQLDHALLVLNVGGLIGFGESGAGFVFRKIAIEIAIVGGQDERRSALDAQVLGSISMTRSGVGANIPGNISTLSPSTKRTRPSVFSFTSCRTSSRSMPP